MWRFRSSRVTLRRTWTRTRTRARTRTMGRPEAEWSSDLEPGPRGPAAERGEQALQRRWAESRWPTPFLYPDRVRGAAAHGAPVRVIAPGRWNHGPGPDFHGAQILDAGGRARRGDVELHLRPSAWLQHGHAEDAAYADILLHVVEQTGPSRGDEGGDPRVPSAVPLPDLETGSEGEAARRLPCESIVARSGRLAVEARLRRIAARRFQRKRRELGALEPSEGPGEAGDRRAVLATARALGQPHNADRALAAARTALAGRESWAEVQLERLRTAPDGWRRGRGAMGSADGLARALETLIGRWSTGGAAPQASFERLAGLPRAAAVDELRIEGLLGAGRATQLLADAVYPLTGAWERWLELPGVRYRRTDELRERMGGELRWRHPETQALLELEQTRCRQWACAICPIGVLARSRGGGRGP
ncbi:MAG: DUF2851 family protein [Chloroflexi bacterium]|nr:DUF2851 family protein [Chloroflexota bacterium]MYD17859.1 DUF2851 family protein [Chloroflexota bacterium]MYJ01378.1 DUF2851 family protein [Chloroflexota bacterium]